MRRFAGVGLGVLVVLTVACGGTGSNEDPAEATVSPPSTVSATTQMTTTTVATTTTVSAEELAAAEYEADVKLIKALTRGASDAWLASFDDGLKYQVNHSYPELGCSSEVLLEGGFGGARVEGYEEEWVVDAATIERDDGWSIPTGRAKGSVPEGRIYIMSALFTRTAPESETESFTSEVHVTVLDGRAYFFLDCG